MTAILMRCCTVYFVLCFFLQLSTMPFFFFNDTATTEIYTLSLHDALPISLEVRRDWGMEKGLGQPGFYVSMIRRSEEHTSELQSHLNLVCRLLLEKKKRQDIRDNIHGAVRMRAGTRGSVLEPPDHHVTVAT